MLAELEQELIAAVKLSPIAANLREVAVMPDGDGATVVKRFASSAPAVYTVAGQVSYGDAYAEIRFDLICIARNARGVEAARHGDAQTIGLYQIIDTLASYLDSLKTTSTVWSVKSADFAKGAVWLNSGLQAGSLQLTAKATNAAIDDTVMASLADFATFHADFDVDPHQAQTEHQKWAAEPPDYTASRPELTDDLTTLQD